ncbi:MAG: VWA domain-containing protein [Salinirussus sp.]
MRDPTRLGGDLRGASEVLGTVLLVSLALAGAVVVVATGSVAFDTVNDDIDRQNARAVLQEMDARFSSLTSESAAPRVVVDFRETELSNVEVERTGYFNLTLNGNPTCSVNHTLSSLQYSASDGEQLLFQTGGVWTLTGTDSRALTSPNFDYRDGTIDVTLLNLTGTVDRSRLSIVNNVSASRDRTEDVSNQLRSGDCIRPDNATITIRSSVYRGWADHLETETDEPVAVFDDNRTVRLSLDQSDLPRRVNDSRNSVVNLSEPAYMRDVSIDASAGTISVDKNAGNNYTVFAEPLTEDRLDIGEIRFLSNATNVTRQPLDVVMVIDQSGSMANTDSDTRTRSQEAQSAAKNFTADLNASRDRVGIVSYESGTAPDGEAPMSGAVYRRTDAGEFISSALDATDPAGVNGSIEDIQDYPDGGTDVEQGIFKANTIFDLKSNETRKKVMIALTDGVNNGCSDTNDDDPYDCQNNREAMDRVNNSAEAGVTVYTIGFGDDSDIDEAFLQRAANLTGGNYYQAEDAGALEDVFQEIRKDVNEQRFVARTPLSTNFTTASGSVVEPQIPGHQDVDSYNDFLNVNDPTAPSKFSHAFTLSDDEPVHINVTTYSCESYEEIQKSYTNGSTVYSVVRCADINESKGIKNRYEPAEILTNGSDASPLIDGDPGFWETDLNETLTEYPSVTLNGTTGNFRMLSNQAIVVFDLPDSRKSDNKLAMLYQIGLAESEATAEGVVSVQVSRLEIEN